MTTISGIDPSGGGMRTTTNRFGDLSSEEFMKIIFTELTNQDPLAPSDSSALLQQLNAIRSIESDMRMMAMLESLVHENQLASSGHLIGKFIGGLSETNERVAGWVVAVLKQGNSIALELDNGWIVPISSVETIIDPALFEDAADPPVTNPPAESPNEPPSDAPSDPPADDADDE